VKKYLNISNLSVEEWRKVRKNGVGGSDIGAICGVNKYSSPIMVYMDKLGLYEKNFDNEAMKAGRKIEPVLAEWFTEETGFKTRKSNFMYQHPQQEWALANVDRFILSKEKGMGILEIKTASEYVKEDWAGNDIPFSYDLQLQWYLHITGLTWGAFAVLIGGNKFRYKFVERDEEIIKNISEIAEQFWKNHIWTKTPPMMSGIDEEKTMLSSLYPNSVDSESPLQLPNETIEKLFRLDGIKEQTGQLKTEQLQIENTIKDLMKEVEIAFAGPYKITWKTAENGQRRFSYKLNKTEESK
jgi:putative phage-type endonuclease